MKMNLKPSDAPQEGGHRVSVLPWFLWLVVACELLFLLLVVAPGRGAGWAVDDGLFLANAWSVAHGGGLDGMLPQEPVYLVNALLFKLGVSELLHFRYAYYFFGLTSAAVFFLGLDQRRLMSPMVPIAVGAALLIAFSSVLFMSFFFLFGAGFYFFSVDASRWQKEFLLILSGIFLAISGFMHAAILIAMVLLVCMILLLDKSTRNSLFFVVFFAATLALWGLYINRLGVDKLLSTPAGHDSSLGHLLSNVGHIVWYFFSVALIYLAVAIAFAKRGRRQHAYAQVTLSVVVTTYFAIKFFAAEFVSIFPELVSHIGVTHHSAEKLSGAVRLVIDVPGAVFLILLIIFYRWLGELCFDAGIWQPRTLAGDGSSGSCCNAMRFREKFDSLLTVIQTSAMQRKLLLAVSGLFLMVAGYAAGSASNFAICLSAFSAPALGIALIFWSYLEGKNHEHQSQLRISTFLLVIWLAVFAMFAVTVNLPTFEPIIARGRVTLQEAPLRGIEEQPRYEETLLQLRDLYKKNGCQYLSFVALDYVPMLYFILQHSIPNEFGVVRPGVYFPEEQVQRALNIHRGWCVLDVTTSETQTLINARESDNRSYLRSWIQQESQQVFQITSPGNEISDLQLYVRGAEQALSN
jgi:hypothetical protein